MGDNREEALACLTEDWQSTRQIADKMPRHGRDRASMIGIAFSALGNLADRGIAEKKMECIARVKVAAFWRLRKCRASTRWQRSWRTNARR